MTYKFDNTRKYIWLHELIHARAAFLNGSEDINIVVWITKDGYKGHCNYKQYTKLCNVIKVAPYHVLNHYGLAGYNLNYDLDEAKKVKTWKRYKYHPIIKQIIVEFPSLWKMMKKVWRRSYLDISNGSDYELIM